MQKIVGVPGYEHFPTIGVVNKLDESSLEVMEPTQRTMFIGSFELAAYDEIDMISPAAIKDLEVVELDTDENLVKLKFTAPGDDGDQGKAAKYEMKAAYIPENLMTSDVYQSDDNINSSNTISTDDKHTLAIEIVSSTFIDYVPNAAGFKEIFNINITKFKTEKAFSFKLRAIDSFNNAGDWSPILTIKLDKNVMLSSRLRYFAMQLDEKAFALNLDVTTNTYKNFQDLDSARSYSKLVIFLIGRLTFVLHFLIYSI